MQDFKEAALRDSGGNAVRQQQQLVTFFYQTEHSRNVGVPGGCA
ncbi:hypothetical protein HMPREF1569_4109 [Klebsiella oxytoca OK-1]|nr:hypothetical protein HMPREF1569_4109 [Klebsiella oxytoca OK-1]